MAENVVSRAEQGLLTPNLGQPRQAASSLGGSIPGNPREDSPSELGMPLRGALGLTRLDSRSKQSLFSLVPKLMMPWRWEVQSHISMAEGANRRLQERTRQRSGALQPRPSHHPTRSLLKRCPPQGSLIVSPHFWSSVQMPSPPGSPP